jgi:hypothetical protein
MQRTHLSSTILMLASLAGCNQGTPGGPGTTDAKVEQATIGQTDNTFNLSVPMMSSTLQQGGELPVTLGIKRAKNFDQDVTLKFADLPAGLSVEPAAPVIKHGDVDAKISIKATDLAKVGEYKVKVTGHPSQGGDATVEFKLSVAAKDTFSLSLPLLSTTVKQGESQTLAIGIKRDKLFDEDVTLLFGELPTGITMEPAVPVIKRGETETKLVLTGTGDAALGSFDIQVTGHPKQGADARSDLKLTVAAK